MALDYDVLSETDEKVRELMKQINDADVVDEEARGISLRGLWDHGLHKTHAVMLNDAKHPVECAQAYGILLRRHSDPLRCSG